MTFLICSKKLNDYPDLLKKCWDDIEKFLTTNHNKSMPILMGSMVTGRIRSKLESEGWTIDVQGQSYRSLYNHNKKMIRENDPILFIHTNKSGIVNEFIEYAKERNKKYYILNISAKIGSDGEWLCTSN